MRAAATQLPGASLFTADAGVVPDTGRPHTTAAVERVIAAAFGAQAACLVQGAGTGAIRAALSAGPWSCDDRRLLIHAAPLYPTTAVTLRNAMVDTVLVDFEDEAALAAALAATDTPTWVYVQHTRQRLRDKHDPMAIVDLAVTHGHRVIVDENYAAVRTPTLGCAHGADASAFSLFKLHGPPGVGVVCGSSELVAKMHEQNYSGGGQVQGPQALQALQRLVTAPVLWAEQSRQCELLAAELNSGAVPAIKAATMANAQDLCVLALLATPCEQWVRSRAVELGAAPYPVGSNSFFELAPLVYRLSNTVLRDRPDLDGWVLRINPMRASAAHIIDILRHATN